MLARVADLFGPGQKPIIQLGEASDAVCLGLTQEAFANETVQPLLLAATLRLSG